MESAADAGHAPGNDSGGGAQFTTQAALVDTAAWAGRAPVSTKVVCALTALMIVAGALRWPLLSASSLDVDECIHVQIAKEATCADVWRASQVRSVFTHPPLYFLVCHAWRHVARTEAMLRLPSFVFGLAAILLAFGWVRCIAGTSAAMNAAIFLAGSWPLIELSAQVRDYTLFLTLAFAALWVLEWSLAAKSSWGVLIHGVLLGLSLLTHYSAGWIMFCLGVYVLIETASGRLPRRLFVTWIAVQLALAILSVWLLADQITGFAASSMGGIVWSAWLSGLPQGTSLTAQVKSLGLAYCRFLIYIAGPGAAFVPFALAGAVWQVLPTKTAAHRTRTTAGRAALIALPMIIGLVLMQMRIYPLTGTRHAIWLIPSIALALGISMASLANKHAVLRAIVIVVAASWFAWFPVAKLRAMQTTSTTDTAQRFAQLIHDHVPPGGTLLVDTPYVLDHYLARDTLNIGRALPNGFTEYDMTGYRVLSIPAILLTQYPLSEHWNEVLETIGPASGDGVWLCWTALEPGSAAFDVDQISRIFPDKIRFQHWRAGDSHLVWFLPQIDARNASPP